jgi:hypothetical protein
MLTPKALSLTFVIVIAIDVVVVAIKQCNVMPWACTKGLVINTLLLLL